MTSVLPHVRVDCHVSVDERVVEPGSTSPDVKTPRENHAYLFVWLQARGFFRLESGSWVGARPAEAFDPVEVEVLDEEAGDDMAHVVRHPARDPQLPHRRVDERVACLAKLPRCERLGRVVPLLVRVLRAQRRVGHVWELKIARSRSGERRG